MIDLPHILRKKLKFKPPEKNLTANTDHNSCRQHATKSSRKSSELTTVNLSFTPSPKSTDHYPVSFICESSLREPPLACVTQFCSGAFLLLQLKFLFIYESTSLIELKLKLRVSCLNVFMSFGVFFIFIELIHLTWF